MTKKDSIPRVAAAIAFEDLNGKRNGYKDAAELWGEMDDSTRRDYRAMARAAIKAMKGEEA